LSKLRPVSHNELIRGLRAFGFEGPLSGGKHLYMLRGNHCSSKRTVLR